MRAVHVMASSEVGGGARYLELILPELVRAGIDVEVITSPGGPLVPSLRERGLRVHTPVDMMARRFAPLTSFRLHRFISKLKPTLVHFHGTRAAFQGTLLGHSVPTIYTSHGAATLQEQSWRRRTLMGWVERRNAERVTRFTGVSRRDVTSILGASDPRAYVPNPVDPRFIRNPRELGRLALPLARGAPLTIGTVARLVPQKGIETLIDAAAILGVTRPVNVILVGDGPLRPALEERAARTKINVEFVGTVSDPRPHLERMQVFSMTSRWEGQPLSVLEAVAFGVPTVVTRCPGLEELALELGIRHCADVDAPDQVAEQIDALSSMEADDLHSYQCELFEAIRQRHPTETGKAWVSHYAELTS